MSSHSLRRRLTAGLLGALVLTWLAIGALVYRDTHREVDAVLDAHLAQTANLLSAQAGHELVEVSLEQPTELLAYGQAVAFQVWDEAGTLVLRSANAPGAAFTSASSGFNDVTMAGHRWRVYAQSNRAQRLRVLVGEDLANRDRIEKRFVLRAFLPLLLGLLLLGALVWFIVGRSLGPLVAIRTEVARRDAHDLAPLADEAVPDEVRPLVAQVNALFARIERSFAAERRFTAQAAHELRTPVAAIRAQADVAAAANDGAESRRALGRVIEGCDRLARLVGQLLVLGRLDELPPAPGQPCSLDGIAAQEVAELAPAALELHIDLELVRDAPVTVQGDATLLAILVRNLVDNAIRHGHAGGRVRITVAQAAGVARLEVADAGPGIDDVELADLGRPFFRLPGTTTMGSGLGLSIVRRIAEAHAATLRFGRSQALGGLEVELQFPGQVAHQP